MLRVARTFLIGVAALVGLAVLAIAVIKLIPDATYKGWIESAVTSATGRKLTIAGDFSVDFGPTVRIAAKDVGFANADWSANPAMVTVKRMQAAARVWPLFNGLLDVTVKADSPALWLETDVAGRGNWERPRKKSKKQDVDGDDGPRIRIVPRDVEITDATLTYMRGDSGSTKLTEIDRFRWGHEGDKLGITLTGRYNDQPVTLLGALSDVEKLTTEEPTAIVLDGRVGQASLSLEGTVADVMNAAGPTVDVALDVRGPTTQVFDLWVARKLPDLGALDFESRVDGSAGVYVADELHLKQSGGAANVNIEGRIDDLKELQGVDVGVQLNITALPAIIEGFGIEVPIALPQSVQASGMLRGGKDALAIDDLQARFDDAQLSATLTGSAVDVLTRQGIVADVHVTADSLAALSKFAGRELPVTGAVNAQARVTADQPIYAISELDVDVEGDALNGKLSGAVADLVEGRGIDLILDANVGSLAQFSGLINAELPETGPAAVKARITEGVQDAAEIAADIEGDWLRAKFQGAARDLRAMKGIDGDINIELNSLEEIAALTGIDLPTFFPLSASGHVTSKGAAYEITNLTAHVDDEALKVELAGSIADLLALGGVDLKASGRLRSLAELSGTFKRDLPETGPLDVSAELRSSDGMYMLDDLNLALAGEAINATVTGSIADLVKLAGVDLDLNGRIRSLADLSTLLERPLPETAPLEVSAQFTAEQGAQGPGNVVASVQGEWLNAEAKGRIGELRGFQDVDADVSLTATSLNSIGELFDQPLPDVGPLQVSGHVRGADDVYALTDVKASIEHEQLIAHVTGSMANLLALAGIDMRLDGHIGSLSQFSELAGKDLPDTPPVDVRAQLAAGAEGKAKVDVTLKGEWIETRINGSVAELRGLTGIDADLAVKASSLAPIGSLAGVSLPEIGPLHASGHIQSRDTTYALTDINAVLSDEALEVHLTGAIADLLAVKGVDVELAATTSSLARLSHLVDAELPDTGSFEVQASVQAESGIAAPAALSARVNSETLSGSIEGTVAELKTLDGLDVKLALDASMLAAIGQLTGATLPPAGPVTASARLVISKGHLAFDPLELVIGGSRVSGSLEYVARADDLNAKGAIRGQLASRHIDLNEILGIEPGIDDYTVPEQPPAESVTARETQTPDKTAERVFSDAPLPLDWLRRHDIDLALRSERVTILHTDIDALSVATTVSEGFSNTQVIEGRIGDRPVDALFALDAGMQPPALALKINLDRIPLPPISELNAVLQGGELLLKVDVEGQGTSMREIMGHLNGKAVLSIRESRTPNSLLNRFGAGISISSINPFDESEEYTTLHCAASRFEFKDGVATTPHGLAIQLPRVTWLGSGKVDFKDETIDLRAQPRARRTVLSTSGLVQMLQFRGPLTNPRLVVNPVGLATSGANIALAFSTGGVSLLWEGLYGLLRANVDRCKQIDEQIIKSQVTAGDR